MHDVEALVDRAVATLTQTFAGRTHVVIDRGVIMSDTEADMPIHFGVSLRTITPAEDVEGASLKDVGITVILQAAENDYSEKTLYAEYFNVALQALESDSWVFEGSELAIGKEGTQVNLAIRAQLSQIAA